MPFMEASTTNTTGAGPINRMPVEIIVMIQRQLDLVPACCFMLTSKFHLACANRQEDTCMKTKANMTSRYDLDKFHLMSLLEEPFHRLTHPHRSQYACSGCLQFHKPEHFSRTELQKPGSQRRCKASSRIIFLSRGAYLECFHGRFFIPQPSWPRLIRGDRIAMDFQDNDEYCGYATVRILKPFQIFNNLSLWGTKGNLTDTCESGWCPVAMQNDYEAGLAKIEKWLQNFNYPICSHMTLAECPKLAEVILNAVRAFQIPAKSNIRETRDLVSACPGQLGMGESIFKEVKGLRTILFSPKICNKCDKTFSCFLDYETTLEKNGYHSMFYPHDEKTHVGLKIEITRDFGRGDPLDPKFLKQTSGTQNHDSKLVGWSTRPEAGEGELIQHPRSQYPLTSLHGQSKGDYGFLRRQRAGETGHHMRRILMCKCQTRHCAELEGILYNGGNRPRIAN